MQIKRLKAKNVFKFDSIDVDFVKGTHLILACTNGDFSQSNGVGKSAILELVMYGLFGETIRGLNDISKNHSEKFELSIEFDDKKIVRTKNKVTVSMEGAETQTGRKTEMQRLINNLIKLDKDILMYTHIFDSEDTFFKLDDSEKKDIFMKLINVDFLDNLYDTVKGKADELRDKRTDKVIEVYENEIKDIDQVAIEEKKVHTELLAIQKEEQNIKKYMEYKKDLDNKLPKYIDLLEEVRQQKKELSALKSKISGINVQEIDNTELKKDLHSLLDNIGKYKGEISGLKSKINKMETTNVCPIFENYECEKLTIEHKNKMITEIKANMLAVENNMAIATNRKIEIENKISAQEKSLLEYSGLMADFESGKKIYKADKQRMEQLRDELRELTKANAAIRHYKDIKISLQDIRVKQMQYAEIQAKYKLMLDKQEKLKKMVIENDIVKKQMEDMDIIKKIFGKDGLKQFAVSKVVEFLESEINNMVIRIFPEMSIKIITDFNVDKKNMLKIKIIRKGIESEIKEFSKGERRVFEIIFQIAMYKLFSKFNQQQINIMFFDEAFDSIDDYNKSVVTDILGLLNNEEKTIFIISHDKQMKQYFDKLLVVDSDGDNSWIKKQEVI